MSGLREDKKQKTFVNIMEAAKEIFAEVGFQNASMKEIAKKAEVGTGTIYNYFPSKGALLLHIFSEEVEQMQQGGNQQPLSDADGSNDGIVDQILSFLTPFTELFQHYPKSFWRDLFHVMTEEAEESMNLRRGLFGIDEELMGLVTEMIRAEAQSESDAFLVPVDPQEAAYAIYSAIMMDTMVYIYQDAMRFDQFQAQMERHIRFLFAGKIKGGWK